MGCVKYDGTVGEVHKVSYIPIIVDLSLEETHGRFWQVQWKLLASLVGSNR